MRSVTPLDELLLTCPRFQKTGVESVVQILHLCPEALTLLDVSTTQLPEAMLTVMARLLCNCHNLERLNLESTGMTREGLVALAAVWEVQFPDALREFKAACNSLMSKWTTEAEVVEVSSLRLVPYATAWPRIRIPVIWSIVLKSLSKFEANLVYFS